MEGMQCSYEQKKGIGHVIVILIRIRTLVKTEDPAFNS